jgi:hypothetical protein
VAAENVSAALTVAVPAIRWLPGTEKDDGHLESLHHLAKLAAPTSRAWTPRRLNTWRAARVARVCCAPRCALRRQGLAR